MPLRLAAQDDFCHDPGAERDQDEGAEELGRGFSEGAAEHGGL